MKKEKVIYEAPEMEILEVTTEQPVFSISTGGDNFTPTDGSWGINL